MKCDVCNGDMRMRKKVKIFKCRQEQFHAQAIVWRCRSCGFEKIATCNVKLWANDVKDNGEPTERTEEELKKRKPKMWKDNKKKQINFQWLDYMFENHKKGFPFIYKTIVPYPERQKYELSKIVPEHRAIYHDKLYETAYSELFYQSDYVQNDGTILRTFYYKTYDGEFFHITVSTEGVEDFSLDEENDIKRILANKPDIYLKVIKGTVQSTIPSELEESIEDEETIKTASAEKEEKDDVVNGEIPGQGHNPAIPENRKPIV